MLALVCVRVSKGSCRSSFPDVAYTGLWILTYYRWFTDEHHLISMQLLESTAMLDYSPTILVSTRVVIKLWLCFLIVCLILIQQFHLSVYTLKVQQVSCPTNILSHRSLPYVPATNSHRLQLDGIAQLEERLPSMHQARVPFLALQTLDMAVHPCNPSALEVQGEGSEVQAVGHPGLVDMIQWTSNTSQTKDTLIYYRRVSNALPQEWIWLACKRTHALF